MLANIVCMGYTQLLALAIVKKYIWLLAPGYADTCLLQEKKSHRVILHDFDNVPEVERIANNL